MGPASKKMRILEIYTSNIELALEFIIDLTILVIAADLLKIDIHFECFEKSIHGLNL